VSPVISWKVTTLGKLCAEGGGGVQTGPFGSQLHAADYVSVGVPSVMPQNIGDNTISADGIAMIGDADAERLSKYRLRAGDIVYSRRGDVEKRAYVRPESDGWLCGTGCLRVRLGDYARHDSRFISYQLGTEESRAWIVRHAVGATMPNLNTTILSNVPIRVPSLSEQLAIADVLGALDDKIAANANLANSLARLAEAHFTALRWSTEAPISAISQLVDTQYGLTASACQGEGPRFLRVTDINKTPWVDWDGAPACEINESDWSKYRLVPGDILVARMADPGKAAFIDSGDPDAVFASYLVRLKAHDPTQALYIYYFLRSPEYWEYAEGAMTGSVQKNMNAKVIVATDISMPNGSDLGPFNRTVGALRASMRATLVESHRIAAMRDALLPQMMSGKIRVRDAAQLVGDVV